MGIVGVGIEWVDTRRFGRVRARFGDRFGEKLFTGEELEYAARFSDASRSAQALGVRFAAKVATRRVLSAAGTAGIRWKDVEVIRGPNGQPSLRFSGAASEAANQLGANRSWLTLSHDAHHCLGQVVLEAGR